MKIHEYQGKELLRKFGVPVPRGIVARSPEEAYQAAKELATDLVVVKAQIHAGGRGKGGGVKLAKSPEEAREIARQMLGMKLVTHQTGPEGREVRVLLIEEGLHKLYGLVDQLSTNSQAKRQLARLESPEANCRIHSLFQYLFRGPGRNFFNIHASRFRRHEYRTS